jgi:hypothetical protein
MKGPAAVFLSLLAVANCAPSFSPRDDWLGEVRTENGAEYQCKCYSDNACWPKTAEWTALNTTVGGNLKSAIPPAAVCHNSIGNTSISVYNAAACANVQANWINEQFL